MFDQRKAVQITAYLACLHEGNVIDIHKAAQLIYLADRECICRYHIPLLFETRASGARGPINLETLALLESSDADWEWEEYLIRKEGNLLSVPDDLEIEHLDELNEAEEDVLGDIADLFRYMSPDELAEFAMGLPEWRAPAGEPEPISFEQMVDGMVERSKAIILQCLEEAHAIHDAIEEVKSVRNLH